LRRVEGSREPSLGSELAVVGEGLAERLKDLFRIGIGPTTVRTAEILAAGSRNVNALLDLILHEAGKPASLEGGLIGVLVVADVINGDGDEVLFYELQDLGSGPDELPGLDSVLSAAATRVAEVHPHQHRLIFALGLNEAVEDCGLPVDALECEILLRWRSVRSHGGEGRIAKLGRSGLGEQAHDDGEDHAGIIVEVDISLLSLSEPK
jgi:hypothetical protein